MILNKAKRTFKELSQCGLHLLQKPPLPETRFIIFGDSRSGSTLLVNLLNSSGLVHCDGEILNTKPRVFLPRLYIDVRASRSQFPVYGFKLLNYQIKEIQKIKNAERFLLDLHTDGYKFVHLIRKNKLYHALSQVNALEKKKFHYRVSEEKFVYKPIRVDVNNVISWITKDEKITNYYSKLIQQIPHLKLTYENNLKDSANHQATVDQVLSFLNLSSRLVKANLRKIMPAKLTDMVENYEEPSEAIMTHPKYSHFLEDAQYY